MPFELPVTSAVRPVSFKSIVSPKVFGGLACPVSQAVSIALMTDWASLQRGYRRY
jgi:hypothetical protein